MVWVRLLILFDKLDISQSHRLAPGDICIRVSFQNRLKQFSGNFLFIIHFILTFLTLFRVFVFGWFSFCQENALNWGEVNNLNDVCWKKQFNNQETNYIVNFNFKLRSRSKVRSQVRSSRSSSKLKDLHMGMCYTVYTKFGLPPSTQPANCP